MATYTVHEPTRRTVDILAHTDRFVFVRDGFSWSAFLFGPLWMLRHRLWLALIAYLVVVTVLGIGLKSSGAMGGAAIAVGLLLAILIGIEASSLRRWGLERRHWTGLGVVVADDLEAAERRFFDAWMAREPKLEPARSSGQSAPPGGITSPPPMPDVIGLFPESGMHS